MYKDPELFKALTTEYVDLSVKVNACFANDPAFYKQLQERRKKEQEERDAEKANSESQTSLADGNQADEIDPYKDLPKVDWNAHKGFGRGM